MQYTLEYIEKLLKSNSKAVERAILALYNLQTPAEKQFKKTFHHNNEGFSEADARLGSYYAEWLLKGNHLTEPHLTSAKRISLKYKNQLLNIARKNRNHAV